MDVHVKEFFRIASKDAPPGAFHKVIALHEAPDGSTDELVKKFACLPRGWVELAMLPIRDRIDLLRDFWLSKLPFCPHILERLDSFFEKLDDVGIFVMQRKYDDPWECELVYSLRNDGGFFRGRPPASDEQLFNLQKCFPETILPEDYVAFMRIHNGFSKANDTGIIPVEKVWKIYNDLQSSFAAGERLSMNSGKLVNPKSLIPFYESFGMPFFQCFWSDWYPESEMGTVYYSGNSNRISDVECADPSDDQMAFPTFSNWLLFYLETIS